MLLRLAGVSDADIVADYAHTADNIEPILAELRARAEGKWDVSVLSRYWRSDAATMERFLAHLDEHYGGVEAYLLAAGLSQSELQRVKQRLTHADETSDEIAAVVVAGSS
jgi:protein-tyrosine phosphatase